VLEWYTRPQRLGPGKTGDQNDGPGCRPRFNL